MTVHIVDTVAISACIGVTVINVLGYSSPVNDFLAPLLGMIELIPMLEFGMSEPIQVHAVEAYIMWPAASRNRTIAPNLVDSLARLQQCDEVS